MPEYHPTTPPDAVDIPIAPGYRIDPRQNIWSSVYRNKNGCWVKVKPCIDQQGYPRVVIRLAHRYGPVRIHTLMLTTFVGPRPEGMVARHLDDNKQNNAIENLAWGTYDENAEDAARNGVRGWIAPRFTLDESVRVFQEHQDGMPIRVLARKYKVGSGAVRSALKRARNS